MIQKIINYFTTQRCGSSPISASAVDIPMPPVKPYVPPDAEFDIEHLPVFAVERVDAGVTCIGCTDLKNGEWFVACGKEKHQDFVNRFRKKLKL